jgi:hypothetical protein
MPSHLTDRPSRAATAAEVLDEEPGRELLVVRWRAADGQEISEEDEDDAEELAGRIEAVLPPVAKAEILGFEQGGGRIDILVWGEGSNQKIDQIYRTVAPIFRDFGCPPGSCMIRHYDGGEHELPSDEVGLGQHTDSPGPPCDPYG